jgi:hypothetical protein
LSKISISSFFTARCMDSASLPLIYFFCDIFGFVIFKTRFVCFRKSNPSAHHSTGILGLPALSHHQLCHHPTTRSRRVAHTSLRVVPILWCVLCPWPRLRCSATHPCFSGRSWHSPSSFGLASPVRVPHVPTRAPPSLRL